MEIFCPKNFHRAVNLTVLFRHFRGHLCFNNHKSKKNSEKTNTATTSKKETSFTATRLHSTLWKSERDTATCMFIASRLSIKKTCCRLVINDYRALLNANLTLESGSLNFSLLAPKLMYEIDLQDLTYPLSFHHYQPPTTGTFRE